MTKKAIIVSGDLAQDHEFIYPFYRLLEEDIKVDVCLIGGKPVKGILGTNIPPNKTHPVTDIENVRPTDYDLLSFTRGCKSFEKTRQNKQFIRFISDFHKAGKVIACICSGVQLLI